MDKKATATLDELLELTSATVSVSELAKILGVHPDTVRRWEKSGHLKCVRHPVNNYRLFRRADLKGSEFDGDQL